MILVRVLENVIHNKTIKQSNNCLNKFYNSTKSKSLQRLHKIGARLSCNKLLSLLFIACLVFILAKLFPTFFFLFFFILNAIDFLNFCVRFNKIRLGEK